jgi:predicted acetyltransferase
MPGTQTATAYVIKQIPSTDFMRVVDIWSLVYNIPVGHPATGKERVRERIRDFCQKGMSYLVGAYDGDHLAAVSGIIDYEMHLGDRWVKCGGIAGVGTYPEYRRKRLVRALLENCLQKLHDEKVPVASLWPFSYEFYEQLGWAATNMRYEVEVSLSALQVAGGDNAAYHLQAPTDFSQAADLHERWSGELNLSLRRDQYRWQRMMDDERFQYRLFVHRDGYMLWNMGNSSDGCLYVSEFCYLTQEAFMDGIALIGQMDSQFEKARIAMPETELFLRDIGINKSADIHLMPGMMSRVVHLQSFLDCVGEGNANAVTLVDPLGITAAKGSGAQNGPGAFMQHVTGFWKQPLSNFPKHLHAITGGLPAYSVEQY